MSLENNDDDMSMDEILASIRRIIAQDEVESQKTKMEEPVQNIKKEHVAQNTQESLDHVAFAAKAVSSGGRYGFSTSPQKSESAQQGPMKAADITKMFHEDEKEEQAPVSENFAPVIDFPSNSAASRPSLDPKIDSQLQVFMYDLIRPLLKDWVNAYLPGIVEKAVADEVRKMFQKLREI